MAARILIVDDDESLRELLRLHLSAAGYEVQVAADAIAAGYLGSLFLAGAYLAVTCLTSALTRNQVIAFILSVVICLFLILAGFNPVTDLLVRWASPAFVDTVAAFSVITHFDGFQKGVIDTRDLFYFLSVIGFALFATGVIIRGHRAG